MGDRSSTTSNLMVMGGGFIKPPRFTGNSMWNYLAFRGNYTPYHRQGGPISAHALTDDSILLSVGILSELDLGPHRYDSLDQVVSITCLQAVPVSSTTPPPIPGPATTRSKAKKTSQASTTTASNSMATDPTPSSTDPTVPSKDDPDDPSSDEEEEDEEIIRVYRTDGYLENSCFFKILDNHYRLKRLETFRLRLNDPEHRIVLSSCDELNLTTFTQKLLDLATLTTPLVLRALCASRSNREILYRQVNQPMAKKKLKDHDHEIKNLRAFIKYVNIFSFIERDFELTLQERKSAMVDPSHNSGIAKNKNVSTAAFTDPPSMSRASIDNGAGSGGKFCELHQSTSHNTAECRKFLQMSSKDRDGAVRNRPTGNGTSSAEWGIGVLN